MTRLADALSRAVGRRSQPVLSNYELFVELWRIYHSGEVKYLRSQTLSREQFRRTRTLLRSNGIIQPDDDYRSHWRIVSKGDASAEDVACSVDMYCYIAYLSALQRYGLSNRRPQSLFLVEPNREIRRELVRIQMRDDFGDLAKNAEVELEPARSVIHPHTVRGRRVDVSTTRYPGDHVSIRGGLSRIATIGQTFIDTIESPDRCGGMSHVLEIWSLHARTFLEEIIERVSRAERPIWKVRAGYILDERVGIKDPRISAWRKLAQRGSSRVLDAGKPFASTFSEKWMLSINV